MKIVCYNIQNGEDKEVIETTPTIQITGREVRDEDDCILLYFFDECWFSNSTGNGWYDWTVES
jgi:hypothetical protein